MNMAQYWRTYFMQISLVFEYFELIDELVMVAVVVVRCSQGLLAGCGGGGGEWRDLT